MERDRPGRRLPGSASRSGAWMSLAMGTVRPLSRLLTRRDRHGQERVPRTGGVVITANHVSSVDPLTLARYVYQAGRIPRYMVNESLLRVPVIGRILRGSHQIPVHRGGRDGAAALSDAVQAVLNGEAVVIYAEGTITQDHPELWPMQAKPGAARVALMAGAPVVPVARWGRQEILGRSRRVRALPDQGAA